MERKQFTRDSLATLGPFVTRKDMASLLLKNAMEHSDFHNQEAALTAVQAHADIDLRCPCYCEENVWRLAYRKLNASPDNQQRLFVVFISNAARSVPMFYQRASPDPHSSVCWDYHVVLILNQEVPYIYDMDSLLPYPSLLSDYLRQSFVSNLPDPFAARFRVIPATAFLRHFASDRRHMRNQHGVWSAPPPEYGCISSHNDAGESNGDHQHTLPKYLDFSHGSSVPKGTAIDADDPFGVILSLEGMASFRL